jgi:hypothetical protein
MLGNGTRVNCCYRVRTHWQGSLVGSINKLAATSMQKTSMQTTSFKVHKYYVIIIINNKIGVRDEK